MTKLKFVKKHGRYIVSDNHFDYTIDYNQFSKHYIVDVVSNEDKIIINEDLMKSFKHLADAKKYCESIDFEKIDKEIL